MVYKILLISKSVRFINSDFFGKVIYHGLVFYPAPVNITYFWNFGVYSLFYLFVQIITGFFLTMHYISDVTFAFDSVEHIMRDVNYGWLVRYMHSNGASFFFIVVYIHIFRGFYYGSYIHPREMLWIVGTLIFFVMIVTAFMGYVLPWGQMSFWAATVITNLFSAFPYFGNDIVIWLWGGYSVGAPTLSRFYSFHFIFPFIILFLVVIHFVYLHRDGSNNPLGITFNTFDFVLFYPYYILKDLFGLIIVFFFFFVFVFYYPNFLGHPDNYILANPMVTPSHIVPEWYFLPFYAILRSISNKFIGVVSLIISVIILFFIPFLFYSNIRSFSFRPFSQFFFFFFVSICFFLGFIGSVPVKYPFVFFSKVFTFFYFFYIIILGPFLTRLEFSFNSFLNLEREKRGYLKSLF